MSTLSLAIGIIGGILTICSIIGAIFYFSSNLSTRIISLEKRIKVLEDDSKRHYEKQVDLNTSFSERISKLENV